MAKMGVIDWITGSLVSVGALNWGIVGVSGFMGKSANLVHSLLGSVPFIENLVYVLVGVSGVFAVYTFVKLAAR